MAYIIQRVYKDLSIAITHESVFLRGRHFITFNVRIY
jgi:hypothetical protein